MIIFAFKKSSQLYKLALERGFNKYLHGESIKDVFRNFQI